MLAPMREFVVRLLANTVGLWVVDALFDSISLTPRPTSIGTWIAVYLVIGLLLTLVNLVIKPVVKVLAIPLMILTLGLFALIVNAAMLELLSALSAHTPVALHIDSFGSAIGAGLILAICAAVVSRPLKALAEQEAPRHHVGGR